MQARGHEPGNQHPLHQKYFPLETMMYHSRPTTILGWLIPLLAALLSFGASAQSNTSLVLAFPPGGPADALARVVARELEKELKHPVIVDNKPGANGAIAAGHVARSRPDGSSLFLSSVGAIAINPALYPKLTYAPAKDFVPVALLASSPEVLVVGMGSTSKTAHEFLARAKSKDGVKMASTGTGGMSHMGIVQLRLSTKANILHVPYKGAAPATTDTIGGQVDGFFGDISGLLPNIKGGKLRALAIAASTRSPLLPDVPTFDELGVSNVYVNNWYGLFAPRATSADKVMQISSSLQKVLRSQELKAYADATGVELSATTPGEFSSIVANDTKRWGSLIRAEGITIDE